MNTRSMSHTKENVALITYSPDPSTTTGKKIRNKRRKDTSALKKRPEHVVIDYKYVDLEGSGILAVEGEPTNAKFYTERPVLWKNPLLQYHMGLYQQNIHSQMPTFRPCENGDQLLVRGNYPHGSSEYLVTVFVYKSGVVLIQGRDFMDWVERDLKVIRALVEDNQTAINQSLNESRQTVKKTPSGVAPITPVPKPENMPTEQLISTPAYVDSTISLPQLNLSSEDTVSTSRDNSLISDPAVKARQDNLRDLNIFCEEVQEMSDIDFICDTSSRDDDTALDTFSGCDGCKASDLIITKLNEELAKLENKIQANEASTRLKETLLQTEASVKALIERNKVLELQIQDRLPEMENNKKEPEKGELTRTETCLQKDYQKPRSKKNITGNKKNPKSSMIISSSMGRGVAHKMRTVHDTNCIGMVHPSAKAENLEESAKDMISTYKPDTVTLMGGTNNLSCGERPRAVISKIEHLVRQCRQANPSTKIVVSGLISRLDRPDLNNSITTINAVLKRNASNKDYTFMDNSNITYAHLKSDGLHLNDSGTSQLASNFNKLVLSNTHFHNGHQKIHRDEPHIRSYAQVVKDN